MIAKVFATLLLSGSAVFASFDNCKEVDSSLENYLLPMPQNTGCGHVFNEENYTIFYKLAAMPLNAGERCVWIINVQDAVYYDVTVRLSGVYGDNQDHVVITGIRRGGMPYNLYPKKATDGNTKFSYILEYNILVITLYSDEAMVKSRGFELTYKAYTQSATNTSMINDGKKPIDAYYLSPLVTQEYPEQTPEPGKKYPNNALAVFVVGIEGQHTSMTGYSIMYRKLNATALYEDGDRCSDNILAIKFSSNSTKKWIAAEELPKICAQNSSMDYRYDDLMMFIFQSDSNGQEYGFSLASEKLNSD